MPRGGFRPGAGRPKGSVKSIPENSEVRRGAALLSMTPLEYMLSIMNNPAEEPSRRDRMAMAAAPFCHAKADALSKKDQVEATARTAEKGTDWESLLN